MRHRRCTFWVRAAFAVFVAGLGSGPAAAQTQDTVSTLPRTADGHPNLTGVYNVATITPLERPAEYGGRLVLTDEEAAAMVQYEEQRNQQDLEPVDPDRGAPPVGGDTGPTNSYLESLFRAGGGAVGGYDLIWINPGDRPVRLDNQWRTSIIVDPADGRVPPMTPDAQQRMAALLESRARPDASETASGGPSRSNHSV